MAKQDSKSNNGGQKGWDAGQKAGSFDDQGPGAQAGYKNAGKAAHQAGYKNASKAGSMGKVPGQAFGKSAPAQGGWGKGDPMAKGAQSTAGQDAWAKGAPISAPMSKGQPAPAQKNAWAKGAPMAKGQPAPVQKDAWASGAPMAKGQPAPVQKSAWASGAPMAKGQPAPVQKSAWASGAPMAKGQPAPVQKSAWGSGAPMAKGQPAGQMGKGGQAAFGKAPVQAAFGKAAPAQGGFGAPTGKAGFQKHGVQGAGSPPPIAPGRVGGDNAGTWLDDGSVLTLRMMMDEGVQYMHVPVPQSAERLQQLQGMDWPIRHDLALNPGTPGLQEWQAKFGAEHRHQGDEVRYITSGSGIFDIRTNSGRWMRFMAQPGDLIIIHSGRYHRFLLTESRTMTSVRLFRDNDSWIPFHR